MKKFFIKRFGSSWKTKALSYVLAAMLAIQPLLSIEVDFSKKIDVIRYVTRLFFAAGVALMGKYVADTSEIKDCKKG